MELLLEKEELQFFVDHKFTPEYLSPVRSYVQWKIENGSWDDYNEWNHATQLVERLQSLKEVWFDSHLLMKKTKLIGVLLIVGGQISELEKKYLIEKEEEALLLKYFHIVEKGKGFGRFWLESVVFPFYREKNFKQVYINSSHPASFPFYTRFGSRIATYQQASDQQLYTRTGHCFLIEL